MLFFEFGRVQSLGYSASVSCVATSGSVTHKLRLVEVGKIYLRLRYGFWQARAKPLLFTAKSAENETGASHQCG
jgi:hypothetical protein